MILNKQFLEQINDINTNLSDENFDRAIGFSLNYILKNGSDVKLDDILLDFPQEKTEEYNNTLLKLIAYFQKFNFEDREFNSNLEILKLTQTKKNIFLKRLENFQKELRLKFEKLENDQTPQFQNLKWRLDLQIASRSYQEIFAPKILLQLDLLKGEKTEGVLLETDYANLKHLHEELQLALKAHQTARQKKIQKMFY